MVNNVRNYIFIQSMFLYFILGRFWYYTADRNEQNSKQSKI